jgi:hypothetical protein
MANIFRCLFFNFGCVVCANPPPPAGEVCASTPYWHVR